MTLTQCRNILRSDIEQFSEIVRDSLQPRLMTSFFFFFCGHFIVDLVVSKYRV